MIQFPHILVPTDFSDFSRRALDHAIALARWYDSRVTVLHVVPPMRYLKGPIIEHVPDPPLRDRSFDELLRFKEPAVASGVSIDPVVIEEIPTRGILERAQALPADLVVMGTHGRGGFDRWALGSVTEKVIRKAPCPVLTISNPAREAQPRPLFDEILCALDFSESSMKALDYALSLAQQADARLTLLHVLEWLPNLARLKESVEQDALRQLHQVVPESARNWSEPAEMVTAGKAYLEILRVAQVEGAELIVLGVQGKGAIDRMFFGSTAHHVVREAACPVLSVRIAPA